MTCYKVGVYSQTHFHFHLPARLQHSSANNNIERNASPYSPITAKAASTTTTAAATTTSNNPYFIHHHLIRPSLTNVFDSAIGFESPFFLSNMNQFSTQNSNWNRLATSPTSPKLLSPWTTEISESKLKGKVK